MSKHTLAAVIASLVVGTPASSEIVSFNFTGISAGSAFGGTITYDSVLGAVGRTSYQPGIASAQYDNQFTLTNAYGSALLTATSDPFIRVKDSNFSGFNDQVEFVGDKFEILSHGPYTSFTGTAKPDFSELAKFTSVAIFNYTDFVPVSITSATAVPEPAAWAMMIGGIGAIGFAMRSRKRQSIRITYA